MAGPQRNKKSYFDNEVQRLGVDFLDRKPIEEIQRDAKKRIFKDMAFGNINFEKYGVHFMDAQFLDNLIIVAEEEYKIHCIYHAAMVEFDIKHPGDINVITLVKKEERLTAALFIIYSNLKYVRDSGFDISCLSCLYSQLNQFKFDIANAY